MTMNPKKKRRVIILIILLRFADTAAVRMLCQIYAIYDHGLTTELTVAELNVTDEVDNLYATLTEDADPDTFDACALKELPSYSTDDLEAAIASL